MKTRRIIDLQNKKFPSFTLDPNNKHSILLNIKNNNQQKASTRFLSYHFLMHTLTSALLIFGIIGVGYYGVNHFLSNSEQGTHQQEDYSISLPPDIEVEVENENSRLYRKNGKVIGGFRKVNQAEKSKLLSQGGIFETNQVEDLNYPTEQMLVHIKNVIHGESVTAVVHYFIKPNQDTDIEYNLYFYIFGSYDDEESMVKAKIHKLAKSMVLNK
ncbi:hypothetical protein [Litchfieldia alkalitelluris]|uniref:hypothetical protein n=1 Tax=Litchfieldia alkalitelluris TaxID=304268 RepID=UPI000996D06A|nr:hypothetical protein [Litchfieldia alkalitelluris]